MKHFPLFLKKYFWDIDFLKLDKKLYSQFIIERILEYGNEKSVRWLKKNFKPSQIKNVIYNSKGLSPRSANFWSFYFKINKDKVLCFKKLFQKKRKLIWKY